MNGNSTRLAKMVADLIDCVCELLATKGAGPTCWCGYVPGAEVSWDGCGECDRGNCGMGYVAVGSVFPSSSLPNPDFESTCASPLAVQLTVGALRCVPVGEQEVPGPDEFMEAGLAIFADMGALHEAISCCMGDREYVIGQYDPLGPEGGCAGGQWTVTVAL